MGWHGKRGLAGKLLVDRFHNVVRHERLAVVLANVAVGDEAGFAAQVAGELAAVVVLDDDGVLRVASECRRSRRRAAEPASESAADWR